MLLLYEIMLLNFIHPLPPKLKAMRLIKFGCKHQLIFNIHHD